MTRETPAAAVQPGRAPVYLDKAERFLNGAEEALRSGNEDTAALAALHAAISALDAITVARLGLRSTSPNHADVLLLLDRTDVDGKEEIKRQMRPLVSRKNLIEYEDRLLPRGEAKELLKRAKKVVAAAKVVLAPSAAP